MAAALACPAVRDVVVVTDDPLAGGGAGRTRRARSCRTPRRPASTPRWRTARGRCARAGPAAPVAALNADLPALRPAELARVLDAAAAFPRAFLADAAGIGTTLLSAAPGAELRPALRRRFPGPASWLRARWKSCCAASIRVRQDVDTGDGSAGGAGAGRGPVHGTARCRLAAHVPQRGPTV